MNCSLPTKHQPITATVRRWTCLLKTPKFCRWKLDRTFYFHAHVSCFSLCHEEIHHHLRIIEEFGQKWVWNWLIPFALVRTWWGWLAATAADRTVPLSAPLSGSDLGVGGGSWAHSRGGRDGLLEVFSGSPCHGVLMRVWCCDVRSLDTLLLVWSDLS